MKGISPSRGCGGRPERHLVIVLTKVAVKPCLAKTPISHDINRAIMKMEWQALTAAFGRVLRYSTGRFGGARFRRQHSDAELYGISTCRESFAVSRNRIVDAQFLVDV
jgi:hypothetical protein